MNKQETKNYLTVIYLIFCIYIFLLGIKLISISFGLASGNRIIELMNNVSNPFVGLFIGILATSIVQSSSSTTSLTVALVAAGTIKLNLAIYIVMGANIGTCITNVLVSLSHITRRQEFEHAFSAAIIQNFFNLISVALIFPLEYFFGYLSKTSDFLTTSMKNIGGLKLLKPIELITEPICNLTKSLLGKYPWIIIIIALFLLFYSLKNMVVIIKSLVLEKIKRIFGTYFFKNYFRSMTSGIVITSIVQSSSVTTSLVVPFAAARILTLNQIFPYVIGANIGTTVTTLLASFSIGNPLGLQVALAHLIFNVTGIIMITPIKKIPMFLAKKLSHYALKNRLIPLFYVIIQFFIIPLIFILIFGGK